MGCASIISFYPSKASRILVGLSRVEDVAWAVSRICEFLFFVRFLSFEAPVKTSLDESRSLGISGISSMTPHSIWDLFIMRQSLSLSDRPFTIR